MEMDGPNSSSRQYVRRRRDWRHVKNRKLWCDFTFFCLSSMIISGTAGMARLPGLDKSTITVRRATPAVAAYYFAKSG